MAISPLKAEILAKRIKCHYNKKENTYSFIFDDNIGLFIKVKNGEHTFSVTSEKKILSKIKRNNIDMKDGIKKLFDELENIKKKSEFPASIMIFIQIIAQEIKERKSRFEWADLIDPFLSEAASNPPQPITSPHPPQPVIRPVSNKTTINFKNPVKKFIDENEN